MKGKTTRLAVFFIAVIIVMYSITPAAALTRTFSSSATILPGTVSFDGSVSYTKGYDQYGWPTYRIDGIELDQIFGWIGFGIEAAVIVEAWVWIDDDMIWWYNQGPPDMPWASFCVPYPFYGAPAITDNDIVINQGGTASERTGYKLRVRVRAQITGWTNLVGANPYLPMLPFPIIPVACSWEWSIGNYPGGGGGGHTPF